MSTISHLILPTLFILVASIIPSSIAQNTTTLLCPPFSCGKIHNINYPFRSKGDPKHCGRPAFEIHCENNRPTLNLRTKPCTVESITYNNYSIRLLDAGLQHQTGECTNLPLNKLDYDAIPTIYNRFYENNPVMYISCEKQVSSTEYVPTTFCGGVDANASLTNSLRPYGYIAVGDYMYISDLEESCGVETTEWTAAPFPLVADNTSLSSIHRGLAYGFELTWFRALCGECEAGTGVCALEDDEITCKHYCYEDTSLSERTFRCKLEYYAPFIIFFGAVPIGVFVGLRCLCGLPLLITLVVRKWKKRNLPESKTVEEFTKQQTNLAHV